ncbi:MAG: energy-coupling factor ABC transporter permease [Planctomycetota bacterium]
MHIPDGFVSGSVNAATGAAALGVCALALSRANRTLGEKQVPLLGVTSAFIFAAQMLNFPIGCGTSGHLLGATLAAILVGPLNACLVMTVVLCIQCLGFADGGVTALGSNIFNMGLVGGLAGYYVFRILQAVLPKGRWGFLAAAAVSAWLSVVLAALCCAVELGFSGTVPLRAALPAMGGVHAVIGIGEAVITATVLSTVLAVRPDLVGARAPAQAVELQGAALNG